MRIAALMDANSSATVGKKRNITDNGIVIFSVTCILFIAALNSLTVVVSIRYAPNRMLGRKRVSIPQTPSSRKFAIPVVFGPRYQKHRYDTAYTIIYVNAVLHFFASKNSTKGTTQKIGIKSLKISPPAPPNTNTAMVNSSNIFVRGSKTMPRFSTSGCNKFACITQFLPLQNVFSEVTYLSIHRLLHRQDMPRLKAVQSRYGS